MGPVLVVISGPPASGKSTLAAYLSDSLSIPCIGKDSIKEVLFDSLGTRDRNWSKQLGKASIELLYSIINIQLSSGKSCIVESNFKREWDRAKLLKIAKTFNAAAVNIFCTADIEVLIERFEKRAVGNQRHPGHCEESNFDEFRRMIAEPWSALFDKTEGLIEVDTTDIIRFRMPVIAGTLQEWITNQNVSTDKDSIASGSIVDC